VSGIGRSSEPGFSAMVFQAERSHLLVPIGWSRDFRSQQKMHVEGSVSFIVPGVAETTDVYLLTLSGAKRLRHERTTGGLQVFVDSLPADGMIMLTSDAQAFSQVSQFLRRIASRAAHLHRDAVAQRLHDLDKVVAATTDNSIGSSAHTRLLDRARQSMAICDRDLKNGNAELAYNRVCEIDKLLSQAEYVVRNSGEPSLGAATPLEFHVTTFTDDQRLKKSLATAPGTSKLVGGDFENLAALLQLGWRHQQLPMSGISSAVRLSPDSPHQGSYCLELEARSIDAGLHTSVVATAPVWISSPPIEVRAGELVEISGMARVAEELIGTVDGLQIIDSLGGPGMATRIKLAPSWRPFHIIRGVTSDTQLVVSIALSGLGKAQVDGFAVRTLQVNGALANKSAPAAR
jgi:hypothetical protein